MDLFSLLNWRLDCPLWKGSHFRKSTLGSPIVRTLPHPPYFFGQQWGNFFYDTCTIKNYRNEQRNKTIKAFNIKLKCNGAKL